MAYFMITSLRLFNYLLPFCSPANLCQPLISSLYVWVLFLKRFHISGIIQYLYIYMVAVQLHSHVRFFATPWTAAGQASLSFTISQSLLKLRSVESVMPSNYLVFCHPLLLLPSIFLSSRVYSNKLALIRWPKYWNSSLSNEYSEVISFRMTGLISLLSKGLSRVFSNTMVQKHQFFGAQPSLWSNSYMTTGKNHRF